jgi:hypothetical protein
MRKILVFGLVVSGLFVLGCSKPELTPVKGPDGQEWVAITCSRGAKNCWKAAGEFCPNGYESADEVQSTTHGFLFSTHMRDEMLVRCKSPEASAEPVRASRHASPAPAQE